MLLKHTPKDVAKRAEENRAVSRKRECAGSVSGYEIYKAREEKNKPIDSFCYPRNSGYWETLIYFLDKLGFEIVRKQND